jgi:hypothetical protein
MPYSFSFCSIHRSFAKQETIKKKGKKRTWESFASHFYKGATEVRNTLLIIHVCFQDAKVNLNEK